jgi:hypothetical protein
MKRTCILSWAALLAVAPSLVQARLPGNLVDNPEPYVVSIPPDSKLDDNKRMENQIKQWAKQNGIKYDHSHPIEMKTRQLTL